MMTRQHCCLKPYLVAVHLLTGMWLLNVSVQGAEWKFDFAGANQPQAGYSAVPPRMSYDTSRGYGFLSGNGADGNQARIFAVDVPEGNYQISVRLGDAKSATFTVIKAESRRLMTGTVETKPGEYVTRKFTVNVRRPEINGGGVTSLNERELGPPPAPDWDEHLSFEFNGDHPGVVSMEIKPAPDAVTLFIAGDSTVTDQAREPYTGWGQMLPRFFAPGVAVSNQAESGLTLLSFEHQKRLQKVLSMMKSGDYLFIQFGHNDQKDKRPGAGPFTTYKSALKKCVEVTRSKGGIPVLVTPMERRRWDGDHLRPTLTEYAEAVRQVGAEEKVPVVDLNAMSQKFYAALGPKDSTKAFVFYPAHTFPGQQKPLADNTHHSAYGAYELARCVVEGIKSQVPELAKRLADDVGAFDPRHPDTIESLHIPASPLTGPTEKPAGS